jgi:hypothetical protein
MQRQSAIGAALTPKVYRPENSQAKGLLRVRHSGEKPALFAKAQRSGSPKETRAAHGLGQPALGRYLR